MYLLFCSVSSKTGRKKKKNENTGDCFMDLSLAQKETGHSFREKKKKKRKKIVQGE
jgi:hypothetical protein